MPNLPTCLWQKRKNSFQVPKFSVKTNRSVLFCPRLKIAAFSRFQNRTVFGTPSIPGPHETERGGTTSLNHEWPRQTEPKKGHELFTGAFRKKSSMWIVLVFIRRNTRIHKNGRDSWTFRFGPFFGLVCRGDSWLNAYPERLLEANITNNQLGCTPGGVMQ